jgi:LAO/AO transport system kinase
MTTRVKDLLEQLQNGQPGALARSITLLESRRAADEADRMALLQGCDEVVDSSHKSSLRLAMTGAPGVGKSSLINHYGMWLIEHGHRVAVLAIDPSSERTGGSILGDKTRMPDLARENNAFIRPSPASGHLGGIAEATREAALVCEAAGFDRIIVETVGVGQSEHKVSRLVDAVVFVTMAGSGDGLQGIKRGILETVDVVAVNKADGSGLKVAGDYARELGGALKLLRGSQAPECMTTSALQNTGIDNLASAVESLLLARQNDGSLSDNRAHQRVAWFEEAIAAQLIGRLRSHDDWKKHHDALLQSVGAGDIAPYAAARDFLRRVLD